VRIGADLARRTTAREQRFLLGRLAARLRSRSCLAEELPPEALVAWALAAAHAAVGGAPANDGRARQVAKALGRRARKLLEQPAHALLSAASPPDAGAWRAAAARTADRLGLLLSGDVPTAIDMLLRDDAGRALGRAEAIEAAPRRPDVKALLAFAASDVHFALRQRLRVAIA
jgi:hypothetical protein